MTIYNKFNSLNFDTIPLGLEQSNDETHYFCTPKGANIIGWSGVDGIHFCFIRGFGEMIFAVSPMNTSGNFVHPLANSFSDFLRLILACANTAALEQLYGWNQTDFDTFLANHLVTDAQLIALNIIRENLQLDPMEHPSNPKKINPMEPRATAGCAACAIGVIGSDDTSCQVNLYAVCSSLRFHPVDAVNWQIKVHEKPCADMTIKII